MSFETPLTYAEVEAKLTETQILIDRARAHLASNRHTLDEAQTCLFERALNERQAKLDFAKRITDRRISL